MVSFYILPTVKKLMGYQTQKNIASNDCNDLAPLVNVEYQI